MDEITQILAPSDLLGSLEIRCEHPVERDQVLVSFQGTEYKQWSEVMTKGNISTIIGKAKSRKTYFISLIASATLGMRMSQAFIHTSGNIVIFDTEQGAYHVWNVARRIQRLLNSQCHPYRLSMFCLRSLTVQQRIEVIENYLYMNDVEICFIDGIRDLVKDINSCEEATNIVGKLMKWSYDRKTHISSVLHQNKGKDDMNARGHIGTEIVNKSESVIQVAKHSKDPKLSIVTSVYSRGPEFKEFYFTINADSLPEILGEERTLEIEAENNGDNAF
jgi:hypothetical protein